MHSRSRKATTLIHSAVAAVIALSAPLAALAQGTVGVPMPLGSVSVQSFIGNVIRGVLGFAGVIALVMFIYGGFLYLTSMGNQDRVTKGKNTLIWATLGLIIIFSAYSIVSFVIKAVGT